MLTMADGPVDNLPPGMNAYAGYTNWSGIGVTWPAIQTLAVEQNAVAFSITTNGSVALCADVEAGAMSSWEGYHWGYCSVSEVNNLITRHGRPTKLWTAHYDPKFGKHICGPTTCNYKDAQGKTLVTTADGTQWTNHGGVWDESILDDHFFNLAKLTTIPEGAIEMDSVVAANGDIVSHYRTPANHLLEVTRRAGTMFNPVNPPGEPENLSILDITAKYPQFEVVG